MAHGDITHIDIPADDIGRAKDFYSAVFDWEIAEMPGYEGYPMWRAPNKVSGGGLAKREPGLTAPRSYIEVDSIDKVLQRITERGGSVVVAKSPISDTSWSAVFADTEGNEIGLYEGTTA